jgi:hypothetical protein
MDSSYKQPWRLLYLSLALAVFSVAQDSSSNSDSGDIAGENAAGASGDSNSFVGSSRTLIIALSVVVGMVAIIGSMCTFTNPPFSQKDTYYHQSHPQYSSTSRKSDNGRFGKRFVDLRDESQSQSNRQ